jgi:hypothetical protein
MGFAKTAFAEITFAKVVFVKVQNGLRRIGFAEIAFV